MEIFGVVIGVIGIIVTLILYCLSKRGCATPKVGIGRIRGNKNILSIEQKVGVKVNWQNIDKALHKLIIHEQGILFQRLAIALAKQQWPEMIATQPHKDGGQDAYMPYFESNDKYLSVGCSITANYGKIKKDAERIIKRGTQLDTFIFYTPAKTSNCKFDEWGKKLKSELGCDLQPRTKEDIIHELVKPENHWMCREFLGLDVAYAPDIGTISENAKSASQKIIDQWKKNLLSDAFLVELPINEKTKHYTQEINHEEITNKLINKHRFVLYGPPGAGKTTTLIQLAQKLIDQGRVPFILSLPEWVNSVNDNIIDYLANNPCLLSRSITNENLISLYKNGELVFILNGWNEVATSNITKATRLLARLNREYTAAGIILATRESSFSPPFFDESKLTIKELSNIQKKQIIQNLIPEENISGQIENNHTLSQITRTPLFLIEVIKTYQDNRTLPRTRVEIFAQVIRRIENSSKHSVNLQSPPMSGKSEYYLTWLSAHTTRLGQVIIKYNNACSEIKAASTQMQHDGQLQTVPEPNDIINILCDDHILVRSSYPDVTIRFVHQQFQEYYAYLFIKERLQEIIADLDDDKIVEFQEDIINHPVWEEPLKLLAEEIADKLETSSDEDVLKFGEYLVRWTIPIDPLFAAKLVNILETNVWNIVKNDFESILRKWYEFPDENHKACALASMFATGTDSFSDIIWPLLEHEDDQIRLKTYRTAKPFMVSCLGDNWQDRINGWKEDRRAEFLSELSFNCTIDATSIFEYYAKEDPSPKVKVAAINAVGWYAPRNKLYEVISTCDDETFKTVIQHDYIINKFPDDIIPKATKFYSQALKELDDPRERLRLMLRMHKLCGSKVIKLLKKELRGHRPGTSDYSFTNNILKIIASEDPKWVNLWVCQQIVNGNLHYDYYSDYITKVPKSLIGELLKDFVKPDYSKQLEFETKKLIAVGATQEHTLLILQEIAKLSSKFRKSTTTISEPERNLYYRLIDVVRLVPLQNLAVVLLEHYKSPNNIELNLVLDLLGRSKLQNNQELRLDIQEETLSSFRDLLRKYCDVVLKENDWSGGFKANLSCALALFGEGKDTLLIRKLIQADIDRVRNGLEAYRKGVRNPQTNGACTAQSNWHIRALSKLDSENADKVMIELLNEPEYEEDAADGLVQLLWKDIPAEKLDIRTHTALAIGSHTWREEYIDSVKRKKYAQAIVQRINDKRKKDSCCAPKTLAWHLAKLNDPDTIPLILEILEVPQQFDAWRRLHPLEMLVRNGHCLETSTVEAVIRPAIEQSLDVRMSGKQETYLLVQCLCILVCSNDVGKAVSIIDEILTKHKLWYELRGLIETLGNRKTSEATEYLIHLCQDKRLYNALCYELIEALGKTEASEAKQALLSTIDNSITSHKIPMPNRNGRSLNQALANIYKTDVSVQERIISLCNEQNLSKEQKSIIMSIINSIPSNKAILAAALMISQDNENCSIPYELENAIKKSVIQSVPIDDMPDGYYNLRPQVNSELSMHLFESVINKQANWLLAFKLLGYINWLRIEHGRPQLESRHPNIRTQKPWPPLNV